MSGCPYWSRLNLGRSVAAKKQRGSRGQAEEASAAGESRAGDPRAGAPTELSMSAEVRSGGAPQAAWEHVLRMMIQGVSDAL